MSMKDDDKRIISAIQEISRTVVFERNVGVLLENVIDLLNRKMGMLRGTFTLKHGDELRIEASQGLDEAEKLRGRYRIGEGITGMVAQRVSFIAPVVVHPGAREMEALASGIMRVLRGEESAHRFDEVF